MRKPKQSQIDDNRICATYAAHCSGVQVPIMKLSAIYKVGQAAIDAGADDTALGDIIAAFVETIRCN